MKCDELKAINAYQLTTNTEDSDVFIHNDEFGCGGDLVECYLKSEADAAIAKLNGENERLKKCEIWMKQHFNCEEVIACESAKNRRLKRALWLARAERAADRARIFYFNDLQTMLDIDGFSYDSKKKKGHKKLTARHWRIIWEKVERKCRAMADKF